MARKKTTTRKAGGKKRPIETYEHKDKERVNNPPVGLVTPDTDPDLGRKKTYAYDPHLDPQLNWAGKTEHTSFEVPTVSLHVHERISPRTIIEAVKKRNGDNGGEQLSFFDMLEENPPLREAVEFYEHAHNWSNRMIAGDSLLVMNSLLEKEGLAGKVQMVYLDPPYGIKYGSNFQPFVNKRDVKDGKDEDLTGEPEQIRAFRDTWELGIHSYLTYLRDRLLLARELLTESGSIFVQISDENLHHVQELMDEIFGVGNFCCLISFRKTTGANSPLAKLNVLATTNDFILWYARDFKQIKYRQLYLDKDIRDLQGYNRAESPDGKDIRKFRPGEILPQNAIDNGWRIFQTENLTSSGYSEKLSAPFEYKGKKYKPASGNHWKTTHLGLHTLGIAGRLTASGNTLNYKRFLDDFPVYPLTHIWQDISVGYGGDPKSYVVQTSSQALSRCLLMATDPGDLVFDPTCGSGTAAYVAEKWGRRWITCDTSRVALTLAKQRLMTAVFDYYELAHPNEGVGSGLKYETVQHVTLKSIANNSDIKGGMTRAQIDAAIARHAPQETLYDQPIPDNKKKRVSGPFTVEAVPAPAVKSVDSVSGIVDSKAGDSGQGIVDSEVGSSASHDSLSTDHYTHFAATAARSGETLRQNDWRDELQRAGIRGKAGQHIHFARLEPLPGCRWLHADGETRPNDKGADRVCEGGAASEAQRIVISFGPEHAPLEQRQVALAIEEAQTLIPKPKLIVFAAFQFDSEAAKDVDETNWPGVTLLKAQMNSDLLTDDLKKKRASNESFWLIGQPDVIVFSEQWIVNSMKERIAPYGIVAKLSGADSLAEINGLGREDLSLFIAIAQRRDLWAAVATDKSGGLDSGEHRGGAGAARKGGVSTIPRNCSGLPGRIGDAADFVRELGLLSAGERRKRIDRLRGDRKIADRTRQIASSLTGKLSTIHYSQVTIQGFDYYNTKTGDIESGGNDRIAVWMLDTDYDGRSLYPRQVFFPMAGAKEGWARLAKNLKAEIDEDLIEAYRGSESLHFAAGEHKRIAVKIVDDRGIESLKIVEVE